MAPMGNFPNEMPVVKSARIVESAAAGPYLFDVFVPANAMILDILVHNEVLWDDGTSASLEVGDYASSTDAYGQPTIGAAIDADGFFTAVDLKATDLVAGESANIGEKNAGVQGAWINADSVDERVSLVDRFIRFKVAVGGGDGTAGRTNVAVMLAQAPSVVVSE
jgi:hypothetical protein